MSSVLARTKQLPMNGGFYVTTASVTNTTYTLIGTEVAPAFSTLTLASLGTATVAQTAYTALATAGVILRDEGKTLRSANRIFRKVQMLVSTGSILAGGTDGVSGAAASTTVTSPYLTFYVELPGSGHNPIQGTGATNLTSIVRLG